MKDTKLSPKQMNEFYESLTEQEKKVMDKATTKAMKPYFEHQAKIQNNLQNAFTKFIESKKV